MVNLVVGLIFLAMGAWGVVAWWDEFGAVLRGLIPILCVLLGLAAIGAGMKGRASSRSEGDERDVEAGRADAEAGRLRKAG